MATGSHVPDNVVTNEELESRMGFDAGWIIQRTGIEQRRIAPSTLATSDLAIEAGRKCLQRAGIGLADIDLLIVGTFTPDMPLPSTACRVQEALGLHCPAMDIQAACSGFMYSVITGMQFVASGCSRRALIIGADCNSRVVDPTAQRTFPLFGDAAGAVLLAPGSAEQGFISYTLGADGSGAELIHRPMGGTRTPTSCQGLQDKLQYMQMDGRAVFKWAIRLLSDTVREVAEAADKRLDDIDLLIAHQANIRIIDAAVDALGLHRDKVFNNIDRYGNTSAASIPLALDEAVEQGRVQRGDLVMLSGFGAGLTWGTGLLHW